MNDLQLLRQSIAERLPAPTPRAILQRFPGSLLLLGIIFCSAWVTWGDSDATFRPVLARFGVTYDIDDNVRFWHILVPAFIQPEPGIGPGMILLLLIALPLCELMTGTATLVAAFFLSDWGTTLLTSILLRCLSDLGIERATAAIPMLDAGSSAAAVGALTVGVIRLRPRRLVIAAIAGIVLIVLLESPVTPFAVVFVHLGAVAIGIAIGSVHLPARHATSTVAPDGSVVPQ